MSDFLRGMALAGIAICGIGLGLMVAWGYVALHRQVRRDRWLLMPAMFFDGLALVFLAAVLHAVIS